LDILRERIGVIAEGVEGIEGVNEGTGREVE